MTAVESQHGRALKARLTEQRKEILESLAAGHDYPMCMRLIGRAEAMLEAIQISEDVDSKLNGGE